MFNFAVFDGHGGSDCSEFLSTNLSKYVEEFDYKTMGEKIPKLYRENIGGYWRLWGRSEIERYVNRLTPYDDLQLRIPLAFLQADYEFTRTHPESGSTCTAIYIYSQSENKAFWEPGQVSNLIVAHVGDTRCIICDRFGNARPLTTNHHPSSLVEAERLQRYTADFYTDSFGEERYGRFANTRAFGDLIDKAKGISAEPDIIECRVGDKVGRQHSTFSSSNVKEFGGN